MRPLNLNAFRRVGDPKIPKRCNRILAALQGDDEMVRVSNRYWNFAYRDVKRCDAGIERGLSNNATRTPKDETYDAGCYSAPDFLGQAFGLLMRGPRSEGHDAGERAGARGRAAGAVECEGEDRRGAALVAGGERGRGQHHELQVP